jgi:hypothetical protein
MEHEPPPSPQSNGSILFECALIHPCQQALLQELPNGDNFSQAMRLIKNRSILLCNQLYGRQCPELLPHEHVYYLIVHPPILHEYCPDNETSVYGM